MENSLCSGFNIILHCTADQVNVPMAEKYNFALEDIFQYNTSSNENLMKNTDVPQKNRCVELSF